MSNPIYVQYTGDPIQAIESARKQYGKSAALIMVPASLWGRLVQILYQRKIKIMMSMKSHKEATRWHLTLCPGA